MPQDQAMLEELKMFYQRRPFNQLFWRAIIMDYLLKTERQS